VGSALRIFAREMTPVQQMFSTLEFGSTDARAKDSSSGRGLSNYTIVITTLRTAPAWSLLRAGVPLSLLCDLMDPEGPRSREIYTA
jgi:hypothetical protein